MNAAERDNVLWLGGDVDEGLRAELADRRLTLVPSSLPTLTEQLPASRGLVIDLYSFSSPPAVGQFNNVIVEGLNHGACVALVWTGDPGSTQFHELSGPLLLPGDGRVFASLKLGQVAESIARHKPGPGKPDQQTLKCDSDLAAEDELLIRRAFSDFETLVLEKRTTGMSGASVFFVDGLISRDTKRRHLPYIVKLESLTNTRRAILVYDEEVTASIPFQNRPALALDRYVEGSQKAALPQDFVDRAQPLRDVLRSGCASVFMSSLFEGALRGFRRRVVPPPNPRPFEEEVIGQAKWTSPDLQEASEQAHQLFGSSRSPAALRAVLAKLGVDEPWCLVHGDLHDKNVYVAAASANVILIDFLGVEEGRAVMDPACLEVCLSFPYGTPKDPWLLRDHDHLEPLYTYPLSTAVAADVPSRQKWLLEAVRAVRIHARAEGDVPEVAYAVAVGCYLIRFASYPTTGRQSNGPLDRRALAYHLADQLVKAAADAVTVSALSL